MRLKNQFFYTLREDVKDEETRSGNYLVRSGMIKKVGTGIYLFMPLGLKVLKKIEQIIREEMNKTGAQELLMPALIPEDYYVQSGRKEVFGHDMFSLKDRYERGYVLGPTHEEIFTDEKTLTKYLLFGEVKEDQYYTVQEGDTIDSIAYDHKLATAEFLIVNPEFTSANNLLSVGQQVKAVVISVDVKKQRIGLSLKQVKKLTN